MALTPALINKSPRGLLSWLGLKNGGAQPQQLATVLTPVIEMGEWYFETNSRFTMPPSVNAVLGDVLFAGPTAPTDHNRVVRYTLRATVPAGTICSFAPAFFTTFEDGVVRGIVVGDVSRHSGRPGTEVVVARASGPFFIPPGAAYGYIVSELSGPGPVPVFGLINYCEIRA